MEKGDQKARVMMGIANTEMPTKTAKKAVAVVTWYAFCSSVLAVRTEGFFEYNIRGALVNPSIFRLQNDSLHKPHS